MRQISSKLNMYMARVGIININFERLILPAILWSFGILALLYIIFLGNMVGNIVERRSLETRVRALSSEVGDLEVTYLSISNGIDLDFSYSMGFKETEATFATRKSLGLGNFSASSGSTGNIKAIQNDI